MRGICRFRGRRTFLKVLCNRSAHNEKLSLLGFRFSYFDKRGLAENRATCAPLGKNNRNRSVSPSYTLEIFGFSMRFNLRKA
jgi:hypothetical protein